MVLVFQKSECEMQLHKLLKVLQVELLPQPLKNLQRGERAQGMTSVKAIKQFVHPEHKIQGSGMKKQMFPKRIQQPLRELRGLTWGFWDHHATWNTCGCDRVVK